MLKLFKNLKKEEWCMIAVSLIFIVLQVWLDLTMPEYMADITGLVQTLTDDQSRFSCTEVQVAGARAKCVSNKSQGSQA